MLSKIRFSQCAVSITVFAQVRQIHSTVFVAILFNLTEIALVAGFNSSPALSSGFMSGVAHSTAFVRLAFILVYLSCLHVRSYRCGFTCSERIIVINAILFFSV